MGEIRFTYTKVQNPTVHIHVSIEYEFTVEEVAREILLRFITLGHMVFPRS
jgi:hypothetical protein